MSRFTACLVCVFFAAVAAAREPIRLANNPALSADGQWLAFDWNGDIWVAPSGGGSARQLTANPARDSQPKFSPDGKTIAFVSDREGGPQIFTVPLEGGAPRQLTFHSAGAALQDYSADGKSLLIKATRDQFWRHGERFFTISSTDRSPETMLCDAYGDAGTLSPDGKKLLFVREGENWWRKGYKGSRVSQIWLYDLDAKTFSKILHQEFGSRWPLWKPDGKGFYFVGENAHGSNLCSYDFGSKSTRTLTKFKEDSVVFPAISRDGSLIVFRHLFDLYAYRPSEGEAKKLDLWHTADRAPKRTETRILNTASAAAFTRDGLEIALVAGGDLWVMDTELREPKRVTTAPDEISEPVFAPDGQAVLFVRRFADDKGLHFGIMRAVRGDGKKYWWQNRSFEVAELASQPTRPTHLKISPDGKRLAFVRGRGDLCVLDLATNQSQIVFADWSGLDFDWSPDGKWFVISKQDEDFNRDVWIVASDPDAKFKPFNVSRHPFSESDPVWSPDGKMVAFTGRKASGDPGANVSIVWLKPEDDEKTARDRKLEKALDKMKGRGKGEKGDPGKSAEPVAVAIDFDRLHERVKRISLGEGSANALFWSPDSRKLAFTGTFDGKSGTHVIDVNGNDGLTPKLLTAVSGARPVWLKSGNQIVWLVAGVPTSTSATASPAAAEPAPSVIPKKGGKGGKGGGFVPKADDAAPPSAGGGFTFTVRQPIDLPARQRIVFDTCWQLMRDHWYDAKLGNNDWDRVRRKYLDMAGQCPDMESVQTLVQMMLGELNGSHLGFTLNPDKKQIEPRDVTAHLGVRFDLSYAGPGLKIRDVLPGGPADKKRSLLLAGEIVESIDGLDVSRSVDLTRALNGPIDRDIALAVKGQDGKTRDVSLRPITYTAAQALLYDQWLKHNKKVVADASKGTLGYLHISQMAMPNFRKFEEELVSEGSGKDGLVIDVRENPGGSITDHLLTALTQPNHAITVPRGGGPGYPMDRKVYVSWHKPIVVLCNQNSGSNAEIFSHAIKTLKRGQIVGVPTAGAVVSTGAAAVMDVGTLRMPTRGWFTLSDGQDMEKNGARPNIILWPEPAALPQGRDAQLAKAIEVLQADVAAWKARPQPKLKLSTER